MKDLPLLTKLIWGTLALGCIISWGGLGVMYVICAVQGGG